MIVLTLSARTVGIERSGNRAGRVAGLTVGNAPLRAVRGHRCANLVGVARGGSGRGTPRCGFRRRVAPVCAAIRKYVDKPVIDRAVDDHRDALRAGGDVKDHAASAFAATPGKSPELSEKPTSSDISISLDLRHFGMRFEVFQLETTEGVRPPQYEATAEVPPRPSMISAAVFMALGITQIVTLRQEELRKS